MGGKRCGSGQVEGGNVVDYGAQDNPHLDQIISNMATDVSNKISFMRRVNIANGWDVGTSPEEKSEDLSLGLRDGFCGALSSFSSWISSMVNLFRGGQFGKAFVYIALIKYCISNSSSYGDCNCRCICKSKVRLP